MKIDINIDINMEIQIGEGVGHGGLVDWAPTLLCWFIDISLFKTYLTPVNASLNFAE